MHTTYLTFKVKLWDIYWLYISKFYAMIFSHYASDPIKGVCVCVNIWVAIKKEINEGNQNLVVYHAFFSFICHSSCLMGDDGVAWEYRCIIKDKLDLWV